MSVGGPAEHGFVRSMQVGVRIRTENVVAPCPIAARGRNFRHMSELPTGTVTFFFSDIEGSTRLLEALGPEYTELLEQHNRIMRQAFAEHGGIEVSTRGRLVLRGLPERDSGGHGCGRDAAPHRRRILAAE